MCVGGGGQCPQIVSSNASRPPDPRRFLILKISISQPANLKGRYTFFCFYWIKVISRLVRPLQDNEIGLIVDLENWSPLG